MYERHPLVNEPLDTVRLWRYMDLAKFLHLLDKKALHLAALRTFKDPFEGQPPRSVIASMSVQPLDLTTEIRARRLAVIENNLKMFTTSRDCVFASCWHMNEGESAGMWAQYIRAGEGIAIQTTFKRLKAAIPAESHTVSGAVVQYVDYDTTPADFNVLAWGALKRSSYAHENEFRLIALDAAGPAGLTLPVELESLIENVYVAPTTPDWLRGLVTSLLAKYEVDVPVLRSDLMDSPRYLIVPEWVREA
jgi:hypothetical protein